MKPQRFFMERSFPVVVAENQQVTSAIFEQLIFKILPAARRSTQGCVRAN